VVRRPGDDGEVWEILADDHISLHPQRKNRDKMNRKGRVDHGGLVSWGVFEGVCAVYLRTH